MPQSITKHKTNGVKTSIEHQKLWIRLRRISSFDHGTFERVTTVAYALMDDIFEFETEPKE
jgi:hypothetical protein